MDGGIETSWVEPSSVIFWTSRHWTTARILLSSIQFTPNLVWKEIVRSQYWCWWWCCVTRWFLGYQKTIIKLIFLWDLSSITVFCWLSNVTLWWGHNGDIRESFIFVPARHLVGGDWRHHKLYVINMSSNCFWWLRWKNKKKYFDPNLVERSGQRNVDKAFFLWIKFLSFLGIRIFPSLYEPNCDWKWAWHWRWRMCGDRMGDTGWLHGLTWRNCSRVEVILHDRHNHNSYLDRGLGKWEKCYSFESNWKKWASKKGNVP